MSCAPLLHLVAGSPSPPPEPPLLAPELLHCRRLFSDLCFRVASTCSAGRRLLTSSCRLLEAVVGSSPFTCAFPQLLVPKSALGRIFPFPCGDISSSTCCTVSPGPGVVARRVEFGIIPFPGPDNPQTVYLNEYGTCVV